MRFIQVSLEEENQNTQDGEKVDIEPNKTEQAIDAVDGKDSTDPEKVIKVANYTEELAKIRQKNKDENNEQEPTEDSDQDQSESDKAEGEDNENTDDNSEENNEEENSSDDGDTDAKSQESSDGDEEVAMEQYIQQNMKQAYIAVESLTMQIKVSQITQKVKIMKTLMTIVKKIMKKKTQVMMVTLMPNLKSHLMVMKK
jgi:flagellar motor protein MotB